MTDVTHAGWIWLAKGAGAVAGSAISLAYILPSHRRDAAVRFAVGVACGMVFGGAAVTLPPSFIQFDGDSGGGFGRCGRGY